MKRTLLLILFISLLINVFPQTFDLQFVEANNDGVNFDLKIQIRGSAAFKLGTSNIGFNFNSANLGTGSLLTAHNFSGGLYNTMTITNPNSGVCSINIELFVSNNGSQVATTWTDVATVRFPITNPSGTSGFSFRSTGQNPVHIFKDDNLTELTAGTLFTLGEVSLPVELTSFASVIKDKSVLLTWETKTEVNNYGYEIQRAEKIAGSQSNFSIISFIKGSEISNSPKHYSYSDNSVMPEKTYLYRLKQIDNNGEFCISKISEINTAGIIKEFNLAQNYPNPFNPTSVIEYDIPVDCFVNLNIYDILGNKLTTLINENQTAGTHKVIFNISSIKSGSISSGIYFYRIEAGSFNSVRKMIIAK